MNTPGLNLSYAGTQSSLSGTSRTCARRWLMARIVPAVVIFLLSVPLLAQIETEQVNGHKAAAHEVIVKFTTDPSDSLAQIQSANDIDVSKRVTGAARLYRLHSRSHNVAALVQQLSARADVQYAEPNFIIEATKTPNDPYFMYLWGLHNTGQLPGAMPGADISAIAAWDLSTGSRTNVVTVVDTGVDYTHPDLVTNVWSAPTDFTVTIGGVNMTCAAGTHGFNAITNTCDPMDDNAHGTHVAGTIGASGDNSMGVVGVNWSTTIMAAKAFDATGTGTVADAISAIEFAIQAKLAFAATNGADVRVLSNSWGGGGYSQALLDEINVANSNNILFVAAAGNDGSNNDTIPLYPASYTAPNVIAVAATDPGDQRAFFSNYGSKSVHLGAPGVSILSTIPGGRYANMDGTSMATPHVSGAAMLLLSLCPLDVVALKATLAGTVDLVPSLTTAVSSGGRLNVNKAIHNCSDAVSVLPGSINFGSQAINVSSSAAAVVLSNRQAAALVVNSMLATGDFAVTSSTCGSSVAANANCAVTVSFTPTTLGYRTGTLTMMESATNSPQVVALSGNGLPPVGVAPASLGFPPQLVGTTSTDREVQVTNNLNTPLPLTGIAISGDFEQTNSCIATGSTSGTLPAGGSCTIRVSFKPAISGSMTGALAIQDDGPSSPETVQIAGTGANITVGEFVALGAMTNARVWHTATLLDSGQVLLAGGAGGDATSAELYDPVTNRFTATGRMQNARWFHTATHLPNGKVLLTGGYNGSYVSSAEVYDPAARTFSNTGNMTSNRRVHSATLLKTGKVLIAGGYSDSGVTTSAELYDPTAGVFTPTGSLTMPRALHTATLLNDGTVLMTGGATGEGTAELYDPNTGNFTAVGPMLKGRSWHTATLLNNGDVLIAGGFLGLVPLTTELYHSTTRSFGPTGEMIGPAQANHAATLLADGGVLLTGGGDLSEQRAQIYDAETAAFTLTGSMTARRAAHTATRLTTGAVLIAGGGDGNNVAVASTEIYGFAGAPIASAGANQTVSCAGATGAMVTLDGAASYDPGGKPLTYTWTGPFGTASGLHPTVLMPLGRSTVTVVVDNGQLGSLPATAEVQVNVSVAGFQSPLAELVFNTNPPIPGNAFQHGRTLPLKLQMMCGNTVVSGGIAPPQIAGILRNGDALDLAVIDVNAGQANDNGIQFRTDSVGNWIYNLNTSSLGTGTYTINIIVSDGRVFSGTFVLR